MTIALFTLLIVHGAIHLLGFVKARNPGRVEQIRKPVGKLAGWLWLLSAVLSWVAAVVVVLAPKLFATAAIPALVLSQSLIVVWWRDARFGTL